MKNLQYFFDSPWADAFGKTILHSLWQGVLVVAVYLLISRYLKSVKAKVWLGLTAFISQFALSIITFLSLKPNLNLNTYTLYSSSFNLNLSEAVSTAQTMSFMDIIQRNIHWLAVGWIIGFTFLMIRQLGGLVYIQYLKTSGVQKLSNKANKALDNVLNKVQGGYPNFNVLESDKVDTAMVLGFIKPIILMPTSFVTGLNTKQLELIIAHEIAHIKRYDFLLNLGQTLLENLFFYHPAFWIVSYQVSVNREHACDEWAAELTGDRVLLAKTLAQIQLQNNSPQLAMAFGKKRMPVLNRIQRLLGIAPQNTKVKLTAILLMLVSMLTFGFVQNQTGVLDEIIYNDAERGLKLEDAEEIEMATLPEFPNRPAMLNESVEIAPKAKAENTNIRPATIALPIITKDTGRHQMHIEYNRNDDDKINIKTDEYVINIKPQGITINGEKQKLSRDDRKKMKEHFAGMKTANLEIQKISKEMSLEASEIQEIQKEVMANVDFNPNNDPKFKTALTGIQEKSTLIANYALEYQSAIQKLNPKDSNYEEQLSKLEKSFEANMAQHEVEMENFEIDMSDFEERMEAFGAELEKKLEVPIQNMELRMKDKEVEMNNATNNLEFHHESLVSMLPKKVRDHLGMEKYQSPPRAPRPASQVRPNRVNNKERPERPEKPEKPEKIKTKN